MKKLHAVERADQEINLYYISSNELYTKYDKPYNSIAFTNKHGIVITDMFYKLSKDTRSIIFEHEVAHAIGIKDEVEADKRAILCYGKRKFKKAVYESVELMRQYSTKEYTDAEINNIINKRIILALN